MRRLSLVATLMRINSNDVFIMPFKTGFDYYSIDTDRYQDIRIKRLKKSQGCVGLAVYDYILCEIYRVRGCFLEWDESIAFDVADYLGIKEEAVSEIVNYCCVVGLFDEGLLKGEKVLTSQSIQNRFAEMCQRTGRKVVIPDRIKIRDGPNSQFDTPNSQFDTPNSEFQRQSKVKKSKYLNTTPRAREFSKFSENSEIVFDAEALEFLDAQVAAWNEIPHVVKFKPHVVPEAIRANFMHRLLEHGQDGIRKAIANVAESEYLKTETGYVQTFKWLVSEHFQDILDGKFNTTRKPKVTGPPKTKQARDFKKEDYKIDPNFDPKTIKF